MCLHYNFSMETLSLLREITLVSKQNYFWINRMTSKNLFVMKSTFKSQKQFYFNVLPHIASDFPMLVSIWTYHSYCCTATAAAVGSWRSRRAAAGRSRRPAGGRRTPARARRSPRPPRRLRRRRRRHWGRTHDQLRTRWYGSVTWHQT